MQLKQKHEFKLGHQHVSIIWCRVVVGTLNAEQGGGGRRRLWTRSAIGSWANLAALWQFGIFVFISWQFGTYLETAWHFNQHLRNSLFRRQKGGSEGEMAKDHTFPLFSFGTLPLCMVLSNIQLAKILLCMCCPWRWYFWPKSNRPSRIVSMWYFLIEAHNTLVQTF